MDCPTCEAMVDAYIDGELTAVESAEFERALEGCPECRKRLDAARALSGLLRELPAESAPDLLRARVERELRTIAGQPRERRRQWTQWSAMAASVIVALGLGWLGGTLTGQGSRGSDALVASYLRVAMAEHAVEVASSDRHTVRPWYAGRIDYAPPVHDLTTAGFPLLGGRLDVIDGRKVAVLVYRRNQHKLAVSLWPASTPGNSVPRVLERDGFAIAEWRHGGFEWRAVSDIAPREIASFAAALGRALDAER
ncbi:anti-sigma factor family protein [Reyranella sp.]|uniref:anti-sigma factor family protein n=1 Tax=Reyranella sp. TaxID=1929291 RepID=UPI003D149B70